MQKTEDNATWQPMELAPDGCDMLLAGTMDHPTDWRIKVGHRDAERGGFRIYGASWEPKFWMPLPAAPTALRKQFCSESKDGERWLHFAASPQTALMLGTSLDPNSEQDWVAECNRLADDAMRKTVERPSAGIDGQVR